MNVPWTTHLLAVTEIGCRLGGAALVVGFGLLVVFSSPLANAVYGPRAGRELITDRRHADELQLAARRSTARLARWVLVAWGSLGAIAGLLVLAGILQCQ